MSENEQKKSIAWAFFELCYAWRRFIIIVTAVFMVLGTVLAFMLPKEYQGVASVLPSQKSAMLSMMGGTFGLTVSNLAKQFAPLVSGAETQLGTGFSYLAILNSRDAMASVVDKFDLKEVYSIRDSSMETAIKTLRTNCDFEIDKYGAVVIKVLDKEPSRAAAMANYFVELLNNINGTLSSEDARNLRLVIERRYLQNVSDLEDAEDSMKVFQQEYGVFSLPDQAKASVVAGAELESEMILAQVKRSALEAQLSPSAPEIQTLDQQISALRQKISDMRNGKDVTGQGDKGVFLPFKEVPAAGMRYLDLYRGVELQAKLLELIYPLYEQAKLEEARETPTVLVLDKAVPPQKKTYPLRILIIISFIVLGFVLAVVFARMMTNAQTYQAEPGTLKEKYRLFSERIRRRFLPEKVEA